MNNKIVILLATYNGEKYLSEQLDSLLNQTYSNWICYVHDDGSTDKTVDILYYYSRMHQEHFKIFEYAPTGGAKENFISLIHFANSEYVMFCDQDDVWSSTKIEVTLKKMMDIENPNLPTVIFTDLTVVDKNLNIISESYFKFEKRKPTSLTIKDILQKNVAAGCTMMINKVMLEETKKNLSLLTLAMHDWGIMLIGSVEGIVDYVNQSTIKYRQHETNEVGASKTNIFERIFKVFSGTKIKSIQTSIRLERRFAYELTVLISENNINFLFLNQLAEIDKKNKVSRIIFYFKNHLINFHSIKFFRLLFV